MTIYWLSHPLLLPIVFTTLVYFLAWLDAKVNHVKREQKTYNKLILICLLGGYAIVYLAKNRGRFIMSGGVHYEPPVTNIPQMSNEVYSYQPNW